MANRIKVYEFNESFIGDIPFKDGVSVDAVSAREIQKIYDIGLKYELIPLDCEHCQRLRDQITRQARQLVAMEDDWNKDVSGLQDTVRQLQAFGDEVAKERDALLKVISLKKGKKED